MFRYEWYQKIYEAIPSIVQDAQNAARDLKLEPYRDAIGLYAGSSSCPGQIPRYVFKAITEANEGPFRSMRSVEDELREVIKDIFGDGYDVAVTNTCESALRVCFEILFAPPTMRKGDSYRGRIVSPYNEDFEFMAAYGRPFPPKYKNVFIDRSVSAGELGVEGKSLNNLDSLFVRYGGGLYETHGIRQNVVPLLVHANTSETLDSIKLTAERHIHYLSGFQGIGYDSPGYGHGKHDPAGSPKILQGIGKIAKSFDLPYLVDCASCIPGLGFSPESIDADIMVWSMDKAGRAPISGLIVGKEEAMVYVRKGMGLGGQRYGEVSSHGKALFSMADPGRDSVVGLTAYLKTVRDQEDKITRPIDQFHTIIEEELSNFSCEKFIEGIVLTKSHHMGGTELNYQNTWVDNEFGIPIFTLEDLNANTNPISLAMEAMGVSPATIYSGNMFLGPGLGTLDEHGELIEERARAGAKALVRALEIVCKHLPSTN